jgi:Domain of unknown function (DUF1902)
MSRGRVLSVRAEYDAEARVWVATSDDVPGLVTEADDLDALRAKLPAIVRELIEFNDGDWTDAPLHLALNSSQECLEHRSK